MEDVDKDWMMIRMVDGWVFLLVPAHPDSPGQRAVQRLLLLYSGIKGNERADMEARQAVKEIVNGKIEAPACVSVADAYKTSAEIAN